MTVVIRPSHWSDYPDLVAIENQIWNETNTPNVTTYPSTEAYQQHHPVGTHLVAVNEELNKVVGFVGFHPPTPLAAHQRTWMIDIGVDPTAQSTGVGSQLLEAVKQKAKEQQIHKLGLRVLATNQSAIRFYQKNGFVIEGTLKEEFWLNGQFVDDILMGFTLENGTHLLQ